MDEPDYDLYRKHRKENPEFYAVSPKAVINPRQEWTDAIRHMVSDALDSGADAALVLQAVAEGLCRDETILVNITHRRYEMTQRSVLDIVERRRADG